MNSKNKRIISIAISSILIALSAQPAIAVKAAPDGSKTQTYSTTIEIKMDLRDKYANQTLGYASLPDELKKALPADYLYKLGGFEGTLKLKNVTFTPISTTKKVVYKPVKTEVAISTVYKTEANIIDLTPRVSFSSKISRSLKNPFTGKYETHNMSKSGGSKFYASSNKKLDIFSPGDLYEYDRDKNSAYGIMGNSSKAGLTGVGGLRFDASANSNGFNPPRVYLGRAHNDLTGKAKSFTWLANNKYLTPSDEIWRDWAERTQDAEEVAMSWGGGAYLGSKILVRDKGFPRFKSQTGGINRYRRGMDILYRLNYKENKYEQKYSYTFSSPPEVDYVSYSSWKIKLDYTGTVHDMRTNNFDISYVKFNPGTVIIPTISSTVSQKTSVTFDVGYTVYPTSNIQASPSVTVYKGSVPLWTGSVPVNPGSKTRRTISLGSLNFAAGHNVIRVVVNPAKAIVERKPKNENAYLDNEGSNSVNGIKSDNCIIYSNATRRTQNTWDEKWSIITQVGNVTSDLAGNKHALVVSRDEKIENKRYNEKYAITEVYFRSKYTKDNAEAVPSRAGNTSSRNENYNPDRGGTTIYNDLPSKGEGWQKLTNGSIATIKAGYGFELFARTVYTTNRNEGISITETFSKPYTSAKYGIGFASFKMISPSVGETITPSALYMTMQNGNGGSAICVILEQTAKSGDWWSETKIFEIPKKATVPGLIERKVYTSESSKPGTYSISIASPAPSSPAAFSGYEAESPVGGGGIKPKLYDYINFKLEILGQDDIKSHIGN